MTFLPKLGANGEMGVQLLGPDGNPLATGPGGELQTMINLIADISGVGNIFGFDNNPSGWVIYSGTPAEGNTVTVTVGTVQKVYTVQAGDTLYDIASEVATLFEADSTFKADYLARAYQNLTFVRSLEQGDEHANDALTVLVEQGTAAGLDMSAVTSDTDPPSTLQKMFKRILVEVDEEDWRVGRIGVFGEVGTRTRADNPIFLSVRKTLATGAETLFFDRDVTDLATDPNIDLAFITDVLVADDVGGELRLYKGLERDRVENFTGDGATEQYELAHNCVEIASYVSVTVGGVPKSLGPDYTIEDGDSPDKHILEFKAAPANGAAIVVTYDAMLRVLIAFVQASASQAMQFGAPIKLERDAGHFLVATVSNKSANAAVVGVNANGFYELKRGIIQQGP